MAKQFFKNLPDTTTPLTASRLNDLLDGEEALGSIVVDDINCKNLLPNTIGTQTISSVTITRNNDGSLTLNGTASANITIYDYFDITLPAGTYTHSCQNNIPNGMYLSLNNISSTMIGTSGNTNNVTFTLSEDTNYTRYVLYIASGTAINNLTIYPMIEKGDSVSNYVSYKKIIKEQDGYVKENTTFYADDFKCRNMLGFSNIRNGIYKIGDGTYDGSGTNACCTASKIEIDNTKNYVLSTANTQTTSYMYVMYYDASGNYLGYINTTFSTGFIKLNTYSNYSNAKYVNFRFDVAIANLINPQFEIGDEVTPYTPYKNFNTTIKSVYLSGTTSANGNLSSGLNKDTTVVLCFHANNNNAIPTFYTNSASNEWTVHLNQVNGQVLANTQASGILYYIELYPSSSTSGTRMLNVVNEEENR